MNPISPEAILNLARNFMESRILLSGAELDLFTILTPVPLSAQEVAKRIGADLRALTILLDALTAEGLLVKRNSSYQCTPAASQLLFSNAPDSVLPLVLHMASLWRKWSNLTTVVQGDQLPDMAAVFQSTDELRAFIGAMHTIAAALAPEIVAAIGPGSSRILLDVGGGPGTYTSAFLHTVPEMKATLFDRPEVIEMAREYLSRAGVVDRVTLVSGDFYRDELPPGHDLAFVSAIIHQNGPEQNLDLFAKVFRSLNAGGRIIIRDHVMESDRTSPKEGAVFAVNMLVSTAAGRTYAYDEIREGLTRAGFVSIRLLQKGDHMDSLVDAFKP